MSYEIENWQHSVLIHVDEGSAEPSASKADGLASRLSKTASELYGLALELGRPQTSKTVFRTLEREYGYLQLWCDGYGAVTGDLDDVLAESKRLRHSTYRLLVSLCKTLTEKLVDVLLPGLDGAAQHRLNEKATRTRDAVEATSFAIRDVDGDDSDTDSDTDDSSFAGENSVEDIIEDIKTDIQCLVDLGPRFKEPIRDNAVAEVAAVPAPVPTWNQAEYLTSRIRHRYPDADAELARILGQANWDRFRRLSDHKERNICEAQRPASKPQSAPMPSGTVVASDFHDSGLGTSMATPSSYAETVLSYHGAKGGAIKIPPAPAEALQGKAFACDICGRKCQLPSGNWKSSWKRHVLSDLQPYVCVVASCMYSSVPFPDKNSWKHHLDLEHEFADLSKSFACPLCQEELNGGKLAHMARHLEELSLTILPANVESDEDSEGSSGNESDAEAVVSASSLTETDTADEFAASDHHQNNKPWHCEVCGQRSFASEAAFRHHRRYHDRPWPCKHPGCERSFDTVTHLKRHINEKHVKTRKLYCAQPLCIYSRQGTRSFTNKDKWKRHMLMKHSIDPERVVEEDYLDLLDEAESFDEQPESTRSSQQATSYWSELEQTAFPSLLRTFGSDWAKIANYMQTKTATMIKNYYIRNVRELGQPEWDEIVKVADAMAQRGASMPEPPALTGQTQRPRRRYNLSSEEHRPLAAAALTNDPLGDNHAEVARASRRPTSYYGGNSASSRSAYEEKFRQAMRDQDLAGGPQMPLTAETLREPGRSGTSHRSTGSSGNHDETELYHRKLRSRTLRIPKQNDEYVTIQVKGGTLLKFGNTELHCADGAMIDIISRDGNAELRGAASDKPRYSFDHDIVPPPLPPPQLVPIQSRQAASLQDMQHPLRDRFFEPKGKPPLPTASRWDSTGVAADIDRTMLRRLNRDSKSWEPQTLGFKDQLPHSQDLFEPGTRPIPRPLDPGIRSSSAGVGAEGNRNMTKRLYQNQENPRHLDKPGPTTVGQSYSTSVLSCPAQPCAYQAKDSSSLMQHLRQAHPSNQWTTGMPSVPLSYDSQQETGEKRKPIPRGPPAVSENTMFFQNTESGQWASRAAPQETPLSSFHSSSFSSSSYTPTLETHFIDYVCCDRTFLTLRDLLEHYESHPTTTLEPARSKDAVGANQANDRSPADRAKQPSQSLLHGFPQHPGIGIVDTERLRNGPMSPQAVPKLDRTMTDAYADELYTPIFAVSSPSLGHSSVSPTSDLLNQRLQYANQLAQLHEHPQVSSKQHSSAATRPPASTSAPDCMRLPLREGSPLPPPPRARDDLIDGPG